MQRQCNSLRWCGSQLRRGWRWGGGGGGGWWWLEPLVLSSALDEEVQGDGHRALEGLEVCWGPWWPSPVRAKTKLMEEARSSSPVAACVDVKQEEDSLVAELVPQRLGRALGGPTTALPDLDKVLQRQAVGLTWWSPAWHAQYDVSSPRKAPPEAWEQVQPQPGLESLPGQATEQ